jgi:uncharacterized membrane protein
MNVETSKNLGGVGAILLVIGVLAARANGFAGLLDLVGLILVLIAMKGFADYYQESGIFNNALYGVITAIIGVVAFAAVAVIAILNVIASGFDITDPNAWTQRFTDFNSFWNQFSSVVIGVIVALVVLFAFFVIAFIFFRKSLNTIATKSGVGMFRTAGLLMLIGAVLTIVLVGLILIWIGFILLAVAFFSIRTQSTQPTQTTSRPPQ